MAKTHPTGYWTLMCNPKVWEIDRFLTSGLEEETWRLKPYNKKLDWFKVGDLGFIRVGRDQRTLTELAGRKRLQPGIYAMVEIISPAREMLPDQTAFYLHPPKVALQPTPRFRFRLLKNLLEDPILLSALMDDPAVMEDAYLIKGQQSSLMPLHPVAFRRVLEMVDLGF